MNTRLTKQQIVAGICVAAVVLLPCRNLWMGDGYTVRSLVQTATMFDIITIRDGGFFISPIPWLGLKAMGIGFAYLCGAVYFASVWAMSRRDAKWLILACLPIIQVFAGYWEIYAPVYAMTAVTFYCIITERYNALPLVACLLMLCHFVVAWPVACLVGLYLYHKRQPVGVAVIVICFAYVVFVVATFTRPAIGFASMFGYYGALSSAHLIEIVCLFAALFAWAVCVKSRPVWWTLVPATGAALMTCVIVPHLGMFRDWDLMSLCLLPVAFAIIYGAKTVPFKSYVIAASVTLSLIVFNADERQEIMRSYMKAAPQYSAQFMNGHVLRVTQYIYKREVLGMK